MHVVCGLKGLLSVGVAYVQAPTELFSLDFEAVTDAAKSHREKSSFFVGVERGVPDCLLPVRARTLLTRIGVSRAVTMSTAGSVNIAEVYCLCFMLTVCQFLVLSHMQNGNPTTPSSDDVLGKGMDRVGNATMQWDRVRLSMRDPLGIG